MILINDLKLIWNLYLFKTNNPTSNKTNNILTQQAITQFNNEIQWQAN